jgi:sterol desaturase/sphingolipid hydroxylase (fatty acid hydroxylase superfamily)
MTPGFFNSAVETFLSYMGGDDGFWALGTVYFGMIGGEYLYYRLRRPGRYDVKDAANNVLVNFINIAFDSILSFVAPMVLYYWIYEHARLVPDLGLWVAIPLSFVGHEIAYYVDHRLGHRVGLFWAFHQVHHSSNEFNFTVAARGFLIDGNIVLFLCVLPLAWLGVPPLVFLGLHALKSIYGIFNHADWVPKLGILEEFMATPANHRAHHGTQDKYIDKNYSQVTVILDRLLGTFQREEERANLGLVTPFYDRSPIATQLSGLKWLRNRMRTADRWQDKLKYLWKPPEWTHDARARQGSEYVAAE